MTTSATALSETSSPLFRDATNLRPIPADDFDDLSCQVRCIAINDAARIGNRVLTNREIGIVSLADIAIIYAFELERQERYRCGKTLDILHAQLTPADRDSLVWRYISVFADERAKGGRS